MTPEVRQRTPFKVVVYSAKLKVTGRFVRPDVANIRALPVQPLWDEATVNVGAADPRGIARRMVIKWDGRNTTMVPGVDDLGMFTSGLRATVGGLAETPAGLFAMLAQLMLSTRRVNWYELRLGGKTKAAQE